VQDQRIGGERPFLGRQRRGELSFHDHRIVRLRNADPIGYPQHMTVDRQTRNAERMPQDDVGSLPPDARKVDQRIHLRRNLSRMALDQCGGHPGERFRFGSKKARGLYLRLELGGRRARQRTRVRIALKERRRHAVDTLVGALRRKHRRDEQLVRIPEVELGECARVLGLELLEDLPDPPTRLHLLAVMRQR
jgi:hypothetical protein